MLKLVAGDAVHTYLQVLPFGELHVQFLEQKSKIGSVQFKSPQAFEGATVSENSL